MQSGSGEIVELTWLFLPRNSWNSLRFCGGNVLKVRYNISARRSDNLVRKLALAVVSDGLADSRFMVRDRDDAVILYTAIEHGVDFLVSGDQNLLVIATAAAEIELNIVTSRQFAETFGLERAK